MLHSKKNESILSWIQSTGGTHIKSLKQLADGLIFYRLIQTLSDKTHNQVTDDKIKTAIFSEDLVKEKIELENVSKVSIEEENNCEPESVICSNENNLEPEKVSLDCHNDSIEAETEEAAVKDSCTDVNGIINQTASQDVLGVNNECHIEKNESFTKSINKIETSLDENNSGNSKCKSNHLINNGDLNGDVNLEPHTEDSGAYSLVDTSSDDVDVRQKTVEETEHRYDVVKRFIENMLELKSEELVNYVSCIEGVEFELAKVTVLILSALVQYSISSKADHITATCCGLSFEAQEEIKDCLELFLNERPTAVEKKEFHAKLARAAKPRISPRKSAFTTPLQNARQSRRTQTRKQQVRFVEEEFESPIQTLLKSPLIKITPNSECRLLDAMRCKDKTIALLTYDLDEEKCNVSDLKKQNEELNSELNKQKKENEKLKIELTETCDLLTKQELNFKEIKENLEKELKSSQNKIAELEKDIAFLREDSLKENIDDMPNSVKLEKSSCCDMKEELESTIQAKENKIKELLSEKDNLELTVSSLKFHNDKLKKGKCFNVVDLTVRNDLRDKCDELHQCLEAQKTEYEKKIKKLKEQLSSKDTKEKDWKALFRKADKDREDAVKWRKKLEEENIKLKAENDLYVKICPKALANINSSNEQLTTTKSSYDSEKIGRLWTLCDEKSPAAEELFVNTHPSPVSPKIHCRTKNKRNLSGNKIDLLPKEDLPKRRYNSLSPKNKSDSILMETPRDASIGQLSCSEKEFSTIKMLVKNITELFLSKNSQKEELAELQMFSETFNSVKDLINVLTLFHRIIMHEFQIQSHSSPKSKQLKCFDVEKDLQLQKLAEEIVNLKKEMRDMKSASDYVSKRKNEDLTSSPNKVLILEEKNKELEIKFLQSQNSVKVYKNRVLSLELKLKELKNVKLTLEKNYKSLESAKNTIEEKYDVSCKENVELTKKLSVLEKKFPRNSSSVDTGPPNANCEQCLLLFEKMEYFDSEKKDLESSIVFLKEDLKSLKNENSVLIHKIKVLVQEKKLVEQQLVKEKTRYAAKIDSSFHCVNEQLPAGFMIKKENKESNYIKTAIGSYKEDSKSGTSLRNISALHPMNKIKEVHNVTTNGKTKILSAFCKAEDEAEMLSQSSLAEAHESSPNDRIKEFQRRNSLYLPHLKSVYALELNTTPTQAKYFMTPTPVSDMPKKHPSTDSNASFIAKRRKISKPSGESELHLSSSGSISSKRTADKHIPPENFNSSTPKERVSFTRRMCQTPTSFIRLRSMLKSQKSKLK